MSENVSAYLYRRMLPLGSYVVVADIVAPIPTSDAHLDKDSVDMTCTSYLKDRERESYYINGKPVAPSSKEQHQKVARYLDNEGFIYMLMVNFKEDYEELQNSLKFEDHQGELHDEGNSTWLFDRKRKEHFDPLNQEELEDMSWLEDMQDHTNWNEDKGFD